MTRDRLDLWGFTRRLFEEPARLGPTWLADQRWFGGKSRPIVAVHVEDLLLLSSETAAVAVLDVRFGDRKAGAPQTLDRYAIVVGVDIDRRGGPIVGLLAGGGAPVIEAAADPSALRTLLAGLASGATVTGVNGGTITYADATPHARELVASNAPLPHVRPVGAEQSNTSVRVGSSDVFKLFRRLESGIHPQIEVGQFLTEAGFPAVPSFQGALIYESAAGETCALGVLEAWIENEGDGWSYVLKRLQNQAMHPDTTDLRAALNTLGTTTADFHLALASDPTNAAFAAEPVTGEDRGGWRDRLWTQADRTLSLVEAHHTQWSGPAASLAPALLAHRSDIAARIRAFDDATGNAFDKIRIHGDFHLGQTLKTTTGFAIIDFEGEPVKPLDDRRCKDCALRDVAGMLRSLEYAVATAGASMTHESAGLVDASGLREAFIDGYRARAIRSAARFLPASPDSLQQWLWFFELEKALYEVEYEANHRPAWTAIPLRGAMRLLGVISE